MLFLGGVEQGELQARKPDLEAGRAFGLLSGVDGGELPAVGGRLIAQHEAPAVGDAHLEAARVSELAALEDVDYAQAAAPEAQAARLATVAPGAAAYTDSRGLAILGVLTCTP